MRLVRIMGFALAGTCGSVASAQEATPEATALLSAMSSCIDWIGQGAPDEVPFADLTGEVPFPTSDVLPDSAVGEYSDAALGISVQLQRSEAEIVCSGGLQTASTDTALAEFNPWLVTRIADGRVAMIPEDVRANYGAPLAICVGDTGAFEILTPDDESVMFFFATGPEYLPPEGVC